jgi:hypothetical protein
MAGSKGKLTLAELAEFERIRLRRRWSYRMLAEAIAARCDGVSIPSTTLTRVLSGRPRPILKTTLYPLRRFLEVERENGESAATP